MYNEDNFRGIKMGATFHVSTANALTGEIDESYSMENIILDVAYQYMAGSAAKPVDAGIIHIGSSAVDPAASQVGLLEEIAFKSGGFTRDLVNPLKWYYDVYFSSEEANGVSGTGSEIREVGAQWNAGPFLNRTIIKDQDGNPRTITKSPSQVLTIRMEFQVRRVA